ncbi:MAG TPA: hypothetical protein PKM73_06345 [Verrucomicrobiota bacterium]|nr:hypothetical protein [Verrucomicrobiota bacterium]HNU51155.1 hypothetical protein [Verrucomicrobiota bacterium]
MRDLTAGEQRWVWCWALVLAWLPTSQAAQLTLTKAATWPGTDYNQPCGLDVVDSHVLVAMNEGGLSVYTTADPAHPRLVGRFDTPGQAKDVLVRGTLAFVADFTGGLVAIDVTNPAAPVQVATAKTGGRAFSLALAESMAVVAAEQALVLVRIANPNQPPSLSALEWSPVTGTQLQLSGYPTSQYTVQRSADFLSWQDVTNITLTTSPTAVTDPGATNARTRFYRAVKP